MAFQFSDINGNGGRVLGGLFNQSLIATGTFNVCTIPVFARFGCVVAICLTQPVNITGTLTASFGSGSTATDFLASAGITLPTVGADSVYLPPSTSQLAGATWVQYPPGTVINFKITAAATTGTASIYAVGFTE
jgi:hypothetical protein